MKKSRETFNSFVCVKFSVIKCVLMQCIVHIKHVKSDKKKHVKWCGGGV